MIRRHLEKLSREETCYSKLVRVCKPDPGLWVESPTAGFDVQLGCVTEKSRTCFCMKWKLKHTGRKRGEPMENTSAARSAVRGRAVKQFLWVVGLSHRAGSIFAKWEALVKERVS